MTLRDSERRAYHAEEDHAGTGPAQGLVRGGCDNVAILKGLGSFLGRHQATAIQRRIQLLCKSFKALGSDSERA